MTVLGWLKYGSRRHRIPVRDTYSVATEYVCDEHVSMKQYEREVSALALEITRYGELQAVTHIRRLAQEICQDCRRESPVVVIQAQVDVAGFKISPNVYGHKSLGHPLRTECKASTVWNYLEKLPRVELYTK